MMSVVLATAWNPRGELLRFLRFVERLKSEYKEVAISLPPDVEPRVLDTLQCFEEFVLLVVTPHWSWGRHLALEKALENRCDYIHYTDFDRLLRWVETSTEEWRKTIRSIQKYDCLVIGRTKKAYETHPEAIRRTEAISNLVVSYLLGRSVDVSAGSKGFSRRAAEYLVEQCQPGDALGTDAEWPLVLHNAGFRVDYLEVDGLDWESADRQRNQAASSADQRHAAKIYDTNSSNWMQRVKVAMEIVQAGIDAVKKEVKQGEEV
jgi:hypothetical protein